MTLSHSKKAKKPIRPGENEYNRRKDKAEEVTLSEKRKLNEAVKKSLAEVDKDSAADLPADWVYNNIDEAVRNCRKVYLIFIALLTYSLLTISTTPDHHLFFGQNLKLPILDVTIPLKFFLLFIPPLSIGFYVYMQLYLLKIQKLIEYAIKECRKKNKNYCEKQHNLNCDIHTNCQRHQNRLYPWMYIFSKWSGGFLGWLQKVFGKFSIWWFLPITLLIMSLLIIKKHDLKLFYFQLIFALSGMGVVLGFWIYNIARELRPSKLHAYVFKQIISLLKLCYRVVFRRNRKDNCKKLGKVLYDLSHFTEGFAIFVTIVTISGFLYMLSGMAEEGEIFGEKDIWKDKVDRKTKIIRYLVFADLSRDRLASEPAYNQGFGALNPINLENSRLQGANLSSAVLKAANLRKTELKNANLNKVDLENANIDEANLNNAMLENANLANASLDRAKLNNTILYGADLKDASLDNTKLNSANLIGATLEGAILISANLENAELIDADLKEANLYGANLKDAKLDGANLQKANLTNANLVGADIKGANLSNAKLKGANLFNAQMEGITGITPKQLKEATNWQLAFYSLEDLSKFGMAKNHNDRIKSNFFHKFNLTKTNLEKANLANADLANANLKDANLSKTNLGNANLKDADLFRTDLQESNLKGVDLRFAKLIESNLKHAILQGADLQGAYLERANLQGADLRGTIWENADKELFEKYKRDKEIKGREGKLFNTKNYLLALYDKEILGFLKLPSDHNERIQKNDLSEYKLSNANLQEADFSNTDLRKTIFKYADLREAKFERADLQGADLTGANLQGANLEGAKGISKDQLLSAKNSKLALYDSEWLKTLNLPQDHNRRVKSKNFENYNLEKANLQEADLWEYSFRRANLQQADLSAAILGRANLEDTDLKRANLEKTDLGECNLRGANLQQAKLISADLRNSNLEKTDLTGANIENAKLLGSHLNEANLKGANLDQTILKEANLQGAIFEGARNITKSQLEDAANWQLAIYSEDLIKQFGLPKDHRTIVLYRKFSGYDFENANLKNADLKDADLRNANLRGANLQEANLEGAHLQEVQLDGADIKWANLISAKGITPELLASAINHKLTLYSGNMISELNLPPDHNRRVIKKNFSGYDLQKADLQGADLRGANLKGAVLRGAFLEGTRLEGANLQGADFRNAKGITRGQIEGAANWQLALYSPEDLPEFGLPIDHNTRVWDKNYSEYDLRIAKLWRANLEEADFTKANLRGANLREAYMVNANLVDAVLWEANFQDAFLQGADIRGADLEGANFQGANLQGIKYFSYTQFSKVKTLYQCQLDDALRLQLVDRYPMLFEELIQ
jgi:uncharacterized protein YjbI with pentapeptide repeats